MTGARRPQKLKLCCALLAACVIAVACAAFDGHVQARAATTGRVVADTLTGLALSGFDPVAYFTDGAPRMGEAVHELTYRGTVWRFHNEGNRAAFARDPEVYAPRFGGYDPTAVGRGVAVPGHPLIWLIAGDRLYLFSKPETRSQFVAGIQHALPAAEHRWREVEARLAP